MINRALLKIAFFSGALAFAQGTSAATFSVSGGSGLTGGCGTETKQILNSEVPVSILTSGSGPGCGTEVQARAGSGSVGVLANFSSNKAVPGELSPIGSVRATATLTDTIFILPNDRTLADVGLISNAAYASGLNASGLMDMSMRFGFTGTVGAGTSSTTTFKGKSALAELGIGVDLIATTGGCCGVFDPFDYRATLSESANANGSTLLGSGSTTIRRSFAHLPTAGIGVRMQLDGLAFVGGFGGSTDIATATASSMNSLGYFKGGDIFDLPDGFTAFSTSGAIVNNRLVSPNIAAVPLPAVMPLLLAGLGGFAVLRRKSQR